ncbi:hypothetical protein [Chryseolinea lacunae]|uniref:Phosphatidate cytidylyltransferase n=1 Tax=Chryseolinea lacunae TaxID=2801331 RepID=A0ABS1KTD4_9BACT|nr:hypothetical protein [Chryseolinea lacunae]MBL0742726.1 hypothetical protein [Chryseolinea lacunae]
MKTIKIKPLFLLVLCTLASFTSLIMIATGKIGSKEMWRLIAGGVGFAGILMLLIWVAWNVVSGSRRKS